MIFSEVVTINLKLTLSGEIGLLNYFMSWRFRMNLYNVDRTKN